MVSCLELDVVGNTENEKEKHAKNEEKLSKWKEKEKIMTVEKE